MSLQLRKPAPSVQPEIVCGNGPGGDPHEEPAGRNVLVSYGIHRGRFPIGGLRIREARDVLRRLLNIDPSAVAVINGTPVVDEDQAIDERVAMLHFVKPSSIKGDCRWPSGS